MTPKHAVSLLLPAACLLTTGCAPNLCDRIQTSHAQLAAKAQPCGVDVGTFDHPTCLAKEPSACTSRDVQVENTVYDCLDRLQACTPGNGNLFEANIQSCQNNPATNAPYGLSAACAPVVNVH